MLAVGAIGLLLLAFRRQQKNIEAFRLFAAKHEAIYHRELEPKNIQGAIYNLGHSSTINNQFIWNMNGKKLSVYRYDYVVGHGKNKSHKKYSVIEAELDKSLPHILLDSTHNDFFGQKSINRFLDDDYSYELEGDFNEHFKLYTAFPSQSEALAILTPDVMQALITHAPQADLEIVNTVVRIFTPYRNTREDYSSLANSMEKFLLYSASNIAHYRMDSHQVMNRASQNQSAFYANRLPTWLKIVIGFGLLWIILNVFVPFIYIIFSIASNTN